MFELWYTGSLCECVNFWHSEKGLGCFVSNGMLKNLMSESHDPLILVVRNIDFNRIATGKEQSLPEPFLKTHKKKDSGEFVDKRSADVVVIEELQQDYRKEIEELKKLIISSRNQEQDQQDDEASN
ncbi:uncharacterized protein G2W53_022680 [Senna tora]|uniref:Uncharacterized protein n=1 Tax=Senna tora TaxID=362788 RepID=A0A834TPD6_9FABA|nr:uncharacterized protein G2W53_022680 [Senna tora]